MTKDLVPKLIGLILLKNKNVETVSGDNDHLSRRNLRDAFNLLEHHIATIQLEKELLAIQKDVETHTTQIVPKAPKIHRSSGGPFEPNLQISSRPELGMYGHSIKLIQLIKLI